ncbi:hypothetical protein [Pseudoxanthomonas mexicana]
MNIIELIENLDIKHDYQIVGMSRIGKSAAPCLLSEHLNQGTLESESMETTPWVAPKGASHDN